LSYVTASRGADEFILYSGGLTALWLLWRTLVSFAWLVLWSLLFFPMTVIVIGFWISHVIHWWTTEYAVTSQRVIFKTGLIRRSTEELVRSRVESSSVQQSILGRLLGFGHVVIRGQGLASVVFVFVQNPLRVKNYIS
jgi:uncharacterized membrane protein YdbT with pleckstrin-like domain